MPRSGDGYVVDAEELSSYADGTRQQFTELASGSGNALAAMGQFATTSRLNQEIDELTLVDMFHRNVLEVAQQTAMDAAQGVGFLAEGTQAMALGYQVTDDDAAAKVGAATVDELLSPLPPGVGAAGQGAAGPSAAEQAALEREVDQRLGQDGAAPGVGSTMNPDGSVTVTVPESGPGLPDSYTTDPEDELPPDAQGPAVWTDPATGEQHNRAGYYDDNLRARTVPGDDLPE